MPNEDFRISELEDRLGRLEAFVYEAKAKVQAKQEFKPAQGNREPPKCRDCGEVISLVKADNDKWDRINADGSLHYKSCTESAWAKKRRK